MQNTDYENQNLELRSSQVNLRVRPTWLVHVKQHIQKLAKMKSKYPSDFTTFVEKAVDEKIRRDS